MRFSVFAVASVPDTATTRQMFGLDDLDDKSVSKVLFHRRKQQTGSSETLRWDQRAIAGISLIEHSVDKVQMESLHLPGQREEEMLQAYYRSALRNACLVSWDGARADLPLIHFRTLMHGLSYPAYWQRLRDDGDLHRVICDWLTQVPDDRPGLDETARKLGYPGLLRRDEDDVHAAWLQGRHAEIQAFTELTALNGYLLALRLFATTGEISRHDSARVMNKLRDELGRRDGVHLTEFLAAWSGS